MRYRRLAPLPGAVLACALVLGLATVREDRLEAPPVTRGDDGPGRANAYYVSPTGDDTSAGTTPKEPWATVAHAIASLSPGDTLYVRGGRYVENITDTPVRPARPEAPILVAAYPGEQPLIEGLLWLRDPSWWTVDGINVTWNPKNPSTRHMVKVTNGTGWTVRNSEFWGARSYAALLVAGTRPSQPADWTVSGNCFHDTHRSNNTNQDHLIYVNTGLTAGSGTIERNLLFNASNGTGVKLGGPDVSGGAANVTVRNNTIHNTAQNVLVAGESHSNTIHGNIFSAVGPGYSSVRGYQLRGRDNKMHDNLAHGARSILLNDQGYGGVVDAGGNVHPVDPRFDDTGCRGFHPLNPEAASYGRYAAPGPG